MGNLEIDGKARFLFPCICSMVEGVLPWGGKGIKGELAGLQAGLSGDAESSMPCSLFTVSIGILFSFLNFALLFLNQIYKTTMTIVLQF